MNQILLEKTTGLPLPLGVAVAIAKGGLQPITLQFLDSGVSGLLDEGAPISLDLYDPNDLDTPLASVTAWTGDEATKLYTGALDTAAGAIAWLTPRTLIGIVTYGAGAVESHIFHVAYGIGSAAPGSPLTITNITVTGLQKVSVPMGTYAGELTDEQIFGYYRAQADIDIIGMHLSAQSAPVGADVTVDVVFGASTEQSKIATLADGSGAQETIFGVALRATAGQVIRLRLKTVGSTAPGSWLTATLIVQPVSA